MMAIAKAGRKSLFPPRVGLALLLFLAPSAMMKSAQAQAEANGGNNNPNIRDLSSVLSAKGQSAVKFCQGGSFETVPIFYSDPLKVATQILYLDNSANTFECGEVIDVNTGSPRSIMIYGSQAGRDRLKRYIGSFDLPRERVNMDLWAIQITSTNKAKLSEVMDQVQRQVDQTREAMQATYQEFSDLASMTAVDPEQQATLEKLGFSNVFHPDPKLSLTQMLLRMALAKEPLRNYNNAAINICNFFAKESNQRKFSLYNSYEPRSLEAYNVQRIFNDDPKRPFRRPFQGFMTLALHQQFDETSTRVKCGDGNIPWTYEEALKLDLDPKRYSTQDYEKAVHAKKVALGVNRRREAIIDFAKAYQRYQLFPNSYNPSELANKASIVDGMLSPIVDAINRDVEQYFIQPTLLKIRQIVGRNRGVEYAEVGRTTIAGINGNQVNVVSGITTSFDEPTPLRLSDWLKSASGEMTNVQTMLPNLKDIPLGGVASKTLLGSLPATQAAALLSALSKEEVRWQALTSGINLSLTPVVMRNQAQATVDVDLKISDPADKPAEQASSSDKNLRPLSRISKSELKSKVYINSWDLFALSSFNNQTTITGQRWYVPLVGTIWEGAFGDIPVVGGWFSFKRPPQNVQHQSIVLTNTLIVPSAMGMASYFNAAPEPVGFVDSTPNSLQTTPGNY